MRKPLSELEVGQTGVVVDISGGSPKFRRRVLDMGITKGRRVKVVRKAPLRDPVEFEVLGYNISLRRDEARHILVEVEEYEGGKR